MYQISKVPVRPGDPSAGTTLLEDEHRVVKLLGYYPAGPLKDDTDGIDGRERRERVRQHDLIKFVAKNGGTRTVRVKDLTLLG